MKKKILSPSFLKTIGIMLWDIMMLLVAGGLALLLRYEFSFEAIPTEVKSTVLHLIYWRIPIFLAAFLLLRMYHFMWRSVSAPDVAYMLCVTMGCYALFDVISAALGDRLPTSVYVIELLCGVFLLTGSRCAFRLLDVLRNAVHRAGSGDTRIMLIGGGEAGRVLAREFKVNRASVGTVCCIIDDNESKWGKYLSGIPIVGGRDQICDSVDKYGIDQIIFAIPTADAKSKREILHICQSTGCAVKTLPSIYDMVEKGNYMANVKDIQVEDLLGRESIQLNLDAVRGLVEGKTVLITGGGGSIGSELARQTAKYDPKKLIILDIYENNAYDIQQELHRTYGDALNLQVIIASVRDRERIFDIFRTEQPELVIHAAAHKHVPLMEDAPMEAVKNNIFGTYNVVCAAEATGVKKFILISTDKAVNPTNFMGASKRFCEMILQSRAAGQTEFCAVRFGNVLGSNGSVVPLFRKQIENGGPVTVTDKRIIRYFMTIPEAVQLVLEAGSMAKRNEIFVLDMGDPVKILDLAENMIRLSGLRPYIDIEIKEIGLRPGEKLYEELLIQGENLSKTENNMIFVEQQQRISAEEIEENLAALRAAIERQTDGEEFIAMLHDMIPTYRSPEEVNSQVGKEPVLG